MIELFRRKEYVFTVDARSVPQGPGADQDLPRAVPDEARAGHGNPGLPVREIAVFGGSSHPDLTAEICAHLRVPQRPVLLKRFANDCLEVQLQSNCRERDVFIIQSLVRPVQENLVELLLMADAARGASARGG